MSYKVTVFIKQVYTNRSASYEMSKYITVSEMVHQLANLIPNHFDLKEYDIIDSVNKEKGVPIDITSLETLSEKYLQKRGCNDISFYVRSTPDRKERNRVVVPPLNLSSIHQ